MHKIFAVLSFCIFATAYANGAAVPLDEAEVCKLFDGGNFKAIEDLKDRLLSTKEVNYHGDQQLERFYWILKKHCEESAFQSETKFRTHMGAWAEAYPKSVTWRILLADALTQMGWKARGEGFAPDVTKAGWEGLQKYLTEAWNILQGARNITRQDPELYSIFINIAQGIPSDPTPGKYLPFGQVHGNIGGAPAKNDHLMLAEQILDEGMTVDKTYSNLYTYMAGLYLERWYGDENDLEEFAERIRVATNAECGDAMYAVIAWSMLHAWGPEMYNAECQFEWPKIKSGFERLTHENPDSEFLKNEFCYMACMHKDRDTAKAVRTTIKTELPRKVWLDQFYMRHWLAWVDGELDYPVFNRMTYAVENQNRDMIRMLAKAGDSLDIITLGGETPLGLAVERKNLDMVKFLIEVGANVETPNITGHQPLISATKWSTPEIIKLLIDSGADPNKPNRYDMYPLHQAAIEGNLESAKALIAGKADPNIRGQKGWAPIHTAAKYGKTDIVKCLLQNGADKNIKTNDGRTALDIAKTADHADIVALLK